jgi:hypothetical protein
MTVGDALARSVGSVHAVGYVMAGLEDEDLLIFANGDVALLMLHALVPATSAGITADVVHLRRVLSGLVSDVADTAASPGILDGVLAAEYPDVGALQAAWRAASPEPVDLPLAIRQSSFSDSVSAPFPDGTLAPSDGDDAPEDVAKDIQSKLGGEVNSTE